MLIICSIVLLAEGPLALGSAFFAFAAILSPPLFVLAVPTLFLFGLWGVVNYLRQKGTLASVAFACIGLGFIFTCFCWLSVTGHELGASRPRSDVVLSVADFARIVYNIVVFVGAAVFLGFPFALAFITCG